MASLVMKDGLFDAQFVRALSYAAQEGADLGECVTVARSIEGVDLDAWFDRWSELARRVEEAATADAVQGRSEDARRGFLRASNYHRTSGLFLLRAPVDHRLQTSTRAQTEAFRRAAALMHPSADVLEIPYEDTTLPAYFFRADADGRPRPTIIATNGYDGTVEELYFAIAAAGVARGYNVLTFDGPGQGTVIVDQGIPFRPDWENVVSPVVDYAVTLPEVDPDRIALYGWSFGGYLAPRAATAEHRLAACISDCGPYDLLAATLARIPAPLRHQFPDGNAVSQRLLAEALDMVAGKPTAGWALRRNMFVHGVDTPMDFLRLAGDYTLKAREYLITCPTFVSATEGDDLSVTAGDFASQLRCPHEYVEFGRSDGVFGHCEMAGREVFHHRMFRWLDRVLDQAA